jgi:hypothetical protein
VESSCEFDDEPSGSIKCSETTEWPNGGLSSSAQYHRASYDSSSEFRRNCTNKVKSKITKQVT